MSKKKVIVDSDLIGFENDLNSVIQAAIMVGMSEYWFNQKEHRKYKDKLNKYRSQFIKNF